MDTPPPIPEPPTVAPAPPQLSEEHLRQITVAGEGLRKIRRVIAVARFDGICVAVFAGLSVLLSLTSLPGLALGGAMGLIALIELRSVNGLRQLNPMAARTLAINQIALAAVLILYALYCIRAEVQGNGTLASLSGGDPDVAKLLRADVDSIRLAALVLYGAVIAVAVFVQGGMAAYYFSRRQYIEDYTTRTPPWVIALQRANGLM